MIVTVNCKLDNAVLTAAKKYGTRLAGIPCLAYQKQSVYLSKIAGL